jgi:predicted RNA-binding protein YlxR (DUF448 family)
VERTAPTFYFAFWHTAHLLSDSTKRQVPQRTCIGCGAKKSPRELLRVASQGGSTPLVDAKGKAGGRGAWVCFDLSCIERALKRRAFERVLKLKSIPPPELRAVLEEEVQKYSAFSALSAVNERESERK